VILRCLTKEALQRYRNAGEVRAALETVQRDLESPSPHPSRLHAVAQSIRRRPRWKTTLAGAAALVAIVALTFALPVSRRLVLPSSSSLVRARIAAGQQAVGVFPFRPLVGEAYVGHIAGGLTESLAARLFPSKALRIAPVGAVERAVRKGSIEQAARELGLDMMVTGTVRQIAGRLRINVNINDAKSGQSLWTEEMSADLSDLLALEGRLHNRVMEAMDVEPVSKHGGVEASRPPTANVEAYYLYLKARNTMGETPGPASPRAAIALFEEALSKDGRFALAYAGQSQAFLELYRATREREWAERARFAADRARQLDPTRPEALLALGTAYNAMARAADAIPTLLRVIDLAPNSDAAYRELGRACGAIGWSQEAMQSLHKAVEINEFEPKNYNALGSIANGLGRYSEAADAFRKVIELEPDNVLGYGNLGAMHLKMGQFDEAANAFQNALKIQENPAVYTNLGLTYANTGRFADALPMLQKAVDLAPNEARLLNLADAYRWLGERAKADPIYDRAIAVALQKLKTKQEPGTIAALALACAHRRKFPEAMQYIAMARRIMPNDPDFIYYEATIQLLADRIPQALGSLRDAFRAGFSPASARQDPDLRILQADPRFRELMTEFKETAAASELRQTLQKWMQDRGLRTTVQRSSPQ
jgi:tetratricopeptide (TPR) repeat protein/TolB-like protein